MPRGLLKIVVLATLAVAGAVASLAFGSEPLPLQAIFAVLFSNDADPATALIVRELRGPRVVLAVLVGAALASSGAAYQSLFRNPLADPFAIGTASGAALGASLAIAFRGSGATVPVGAFVGALLATGVVYLIGTFARRNSLVSLLLAGMAVSSFLSSVVWLTLTLSDQNTLRILSWLMGSFAYRGWDDISRVLPYFAIGFAMLWFASRPLDALVLGEEAARGLGLPVKLATAWIVFAASLATASAVAVSGIIGFVGLIAPHLARWFVGPKHAVLLPASAIVGAILLLVADVVARTALPPNDLQVGIITALLGGPFFLFVLFQKAKP